MARSPTKPSQKVELNTFVQGYITEASPLNFPANASLDEVNFELNRDGTRDRRRGMDYETPFAQLNTGFPMSTYGNIGMGTTYVWTAVAGVPGQEILVVQSYNTLRFYNTQKESVSFDGFLGSMFMPEYDGYSKWSFASVDGYLIVATGDSTVAVVTYVDGVFAYTNVRLRTRDIWGIEIPPGQPDNQYETDDNFRGSYLSQLQTYNLHNQSWGISRKNSVIPLTDPFGVTAVLQDPIKYFADNLGAFPSNSETVYVGLQFQAASGNDKPSERMYTNLYDDARSTGSKAAKGYFIIDLLARGGSRVEESNRNGGRYPQLQNILSTTVNDKTPGGARTIRGFAGRVFYAGFDGAVNSPDKRSPSLENTIAFSQLVRNQADINKCYQEGDPTSRDSNDIVDTDGGLIRIAGAERIVGMRALGSSLLIFCTNGVWKLDGGNDYGFTPTNYKVTKISPVGAFSESSIVEEVGRVFYWARDGIYMIGTDQLQSVGVNNITQKSIQTYYNTLPSITKENAIGVYDLYAKKVRWLYNSGTPFTETSQPTELILDSVLGAFYIHKHATIANGVEAVSLYVGSPFVINTEVQDVIVGVDEVFVGADLVITDDSVRSSSLQATRYLAITNVAGLINFTFALYNNTTFMDWQKYDGTGVDAKAHLLTGSQIAGASSIDKQIPYLTLHFRRTENGVSGLGVPLNQSGCLFRGQWDFANTINSKKWGPLYQAYRYTTPHLILNAEYDTGFDVLTTKNKLRGRGKAFALYMETEQGKDCRILGWNIAVNGNAVV